MKKYLTLILACFPFALQAQAMNSKIYFEHDTIEAYIKLPTTIIGKVRLEKIQFEVKYKDENGAKHKLKPTDAKEIRIKNKHKEIRMISVKNTAGLGNAFSNIPYVFLELVGEKQDFNIFKYYYTVSSPGFTYSDGTEPGGSTTSESSTIIQRKEDGSMLNSASSDMRYQATLFFEDCPNLVKKIKEKEIGERDVEAMVSYYSLHCK